MLHENLNAEHHLTGSLIRTNHWKILKNPQNGFFKSIFSLVQTDGAQMKLTKRKFRQRKFENKQHEVIGTAKLAHRKWRWKLWKIIAVLKLTREGREGNTCCWKNWSHPGICQSLHMKVIASRKSGGWEAEFQERIRKEWACLHRGGSFLVFGFHCQSVFKAEGPTLASRFMFCYQVLGIKYLISIGAAKYSFFRNLAKYFFFKNSVNFIFVHSKAQFESGSKLPVVIMSTMTLDSLETLD